jgi:hypothetical protein
MQVSQRLLTFVIARRLIQDGQHAADQEAEGVTGGEPTIARCSAAIDG